MELQIRNIPGDDGFIKRIEFNHEEIKAEMENKVALYKTLVYGDDQIKEAKADRAELNKAVKVFEDKRKEVKAKCLEPYETFEKQMKELVQVIKEPIEIIDQQVKAYEEQVKKKKEADIIEYFETKDFHGFALEQIFDSKWLNAGTSMKSIQEAIDKKASEVEADLQILNNLEDYQFEATEVYKATMDVRSAMAEANRLKELAKAKAEFEAKKAAEEQRRAEEEAQKVAEASQVAQEQALSTPVEEFKAESEIIENEPNNEEFMPFEDDNFIPDFDAMPVERKWVALRIFATDDDLTALDEFLKNRSIEAEVL